MGRTRKLADLKWSSRTPVEPGATTWRTLPMPDPHSFDCPPPPANDADETRAELRELRRMTTHRTPWDIEEIYTWSKREPSPDTHWADLADELATKHRLSPPAAARVQCFLCEAIHAALICAWHHKWRYLRPRPTDLDYRIDTSVIPVPQHPAYPSGHSTVGGAAAAVLKQFFPGDACEIDDLAEESGISRLKAGIHFRSDHTEGLRLGEKIGEAVVERATRDGGPVQYGV